MERRAAYTAPGRTVKVATILFDNGSSKLKADDKRILRAVTRLQRKNGGKLQIVGHASTRTRNLPPVKHKMVNFQVSAARADRVVSELVRMGVDKEDIQIAAVSDAEPIYYEFMPSGEAGNRRAEVYLTTCVRVAPSDSQLTPKEPWTGPLITPHLHGRLFGLVPTNAIWHVNHYGTGIP